MGEVCSRTFELICLQPRTSPASLSAPRQKIKYEWERWISPFDRENIFFFLDGNFFFLPQLGMGWEKIWWRHIDVWNTKFLIFFSSLLFSFLSRTWGEIIIEIFLLSHTLSLSLLYSLTFCMMTRLREGREKIRLWLTSLSRLCKFIAFLMIFSPLFLKLVKISLVAVITRYGITHVIVARNYLIKSDKMFKNMVDSSSEKTFHYFFFLIIISLFLFLSLLPFLLFILAVFSILCASKALANRTL